MFKTHIVFIVFLFCILTLSGCGGLNTLERHDKLVITESRLDLYIKSNLNSNEILVYSLLKPVSLEGIGTNYCEITGFKHPSKNGVGEIDSFTSFYSCDNVRRLIANS